MHCMRVIASVVSREPMVRIRTTTTTVAVIHSYMMRGIACARNREVR